MIALAGMIRGLLAAIRWLAGFFEIRAAQSMTRLLAFMCVGAAVAVALLGVWLDREALGITAIVGALLGGAYGQARERVRPGTAPPDETPPEEPS
jgi:hypothetical protein